MKLPVKSSIISVVQKLQPHIQKTFCAHIDGIFGSYAKGTMTENSDLDLLVTFLPKANLFHFVELSDFLSAQLGVKVDVISRNAIRKDYENSILETVEWI